MAKIVDTNGYWEIKHNPISKVGVFAYLGRSISDECEPDKIYYVYRPAETLIKSVDTWDNPPKPFINDHEMLGEGFSKIDDRPVQGVIHNPVFENDVLYADLSVYSESLKDSIENGKKELSLGYFCKYKKEKGVYKGQTYDYVQEDMVGNHIALVDNGRCGSDVKVFDSKCTFDSLDLTESFKSEENNDLKKNASNGIMETETETKDSEMADKREYIRKIMAIAGKPDSDFEGGEKEKIETIAKLLENSEYSKSEDEEEKKEEKETEDKCGKDDESKEEEKKSEDESEEKKDDDKKAEDEDILASDVMAFLKMILEEVRYIAGKKTTDEDEEKKDDKAEDESEKEDDKKSEDEDEKAEEKEAKDSDDVVLTFAKDGADEPKGFMEDPALRKYLNI